MAAALWIWAEPIRRHNESEPSSVSGLDQLLKLPPGMMAAGILGADPAAAGQTTGRRCGTWLLWRHCRI